MSESPETLRVLSAGSTDLCVSERKYRSQRSFLFVQVQSPLLAPKTCAHV